MPPLRIMPLGDSMTYGVDYDHPTTFDSYRKVLWYLLDGAGWDVEFVGSQSDGTGSGWSKGHEGHGGYRTDEITANIEGWLASARPEVVLLLIGVNDIIQGQEASLATDWATLLTTIRTAAPHVQVLMSPLLPAPALAQEALLLAKNALLPGVIETARAAGVLVELASVGDQMFWADGAISSDGLHPSEAGYTRMAHLWFHALLRVLPERTNVRWDRAVVRHSALASGQRVSLWYRFSDRGVWKALGTSSTEGATSSVFLFPTHARGDLIAFRTGLTGTAGSSSPLVVYAVSAFYRPSPPPKREWDLTIDLKGTANTLSRPARARTLADGTHEIRTGEEIADEIQTLADSTVPLPFLDKDRRRQIMVEVKSFHTADAPLPQLEAMEAGWDLVGKLTLQEV